ncbi:MAG: hypothetical protein M3R06_04990 [Chloroflexota bacterium]|nr:hypothetical protein [Chloroflexota bacterium]
MRHWFRVAAPRDNSARWQALTVGHEYVITDSARVDLVANHWHPGGASPIQFPHPHIGARTPIVEFAKAHLLADPISLVDIVRFAISEIGVSPLRPDWETVLEQASAGLSVPT